MKDFLPVQLLTENKIYSAGRSPVTGYSLSIDGTFAGASVEFGYLNPITHEFFRYNATPIFTENNQQTVTVMVDIEVAYRVSDATATTRLTAALFETCLGPLYEFKEGGFIEYEVVY